MQIFVSLLSWSLWCPSVFVCWFLRLVVCRFLSFKLCDHFMKLLQCEEIFRNTFETPQLRWLVVFILRQPSCLPTIVLLFLVFNNMDNFNIYETKIYNSGNLEWDHLFTRCNSYHLCQTKNLFGRTCAGIEFDMQLFFLIHWGKWTNPFLCKERESRENVISLASLVQLWAPQRYIETKRPQRNRRSCHMESVTGTPTLSLNLHYTATMSQDDWHQYCLFILSLTFFTLSM